MEITLIKVGKNLKPAFTSDEEALQKIKSGDAIRVTFKKVRNLQHHKKFFTLVQLIVDNLPDGFVFEPMKGIYRPVKSKEDVLKMLKHLTGRFEYVIGFDGGAHPEYQSISFDKMGQDEFEEFYTNCIEVTCDAILPGVNREDLLEMVLGYLGE